MHGSRERRDEGTAADPTVHSPPHRPVARNSVDQRCDWGVGRRNSRALRGVQGERRTSSGERIVLPDRLKKERPRRAFERTKTPETMVETDTAAAIRVAMPAWSSRATAPCSQHRNLIGDQGSRSPQTASRFQGFRISRATKALASLSSTNVCFSGSQFTLRPSRSEITPR